MSPVVPAYHGDADIFRFVTAMKPFKDVRNLLLESYLFFLLYKGNFSKNPEFLHEEYEMFDLDAMDNTECKS